MTTRWALAETETELELALSRTSSAALMLPPGQMRRDPAGQRAMRFAAALRRQAFFPTAHFTLRFLERALAGGVRLDPRTFRAEFYRAPHFQQTRAGYTTRVAVIRGIPVLYRLGGPRGRHVVLVGVLPPDARLPMRPAAPPPQREVEAFLAERQVGRGGAEEISTPDSVRWLQLALNQILGLRLAVDGVIGGQTRQAVTRFQQQQGLPETGRVDRATSLRLVSALGGPAAAGAPCDQVETWKVLDQFEFDSARVLPAHQRRIVAVARCILASRGTARPFRSVRIVGHTDPVGGAAYNEQLAQRRAEQVALHLRETLNRILPGSASGVQLVARSMGERQAVSGNPARNRRVELCLSTQPSPPPPPVCACFDFFAEYDLRFEPTSPTRGVPANPSMSAAEKARRIADVNAMVSELLRRRDNRAALALLGRVPVAAAATGSLVAVTRRLSTSQLALYRQCLPDGTGGINFEDFERCFVAFANGELRNPALGSGVGGPNGGFYFLFAEFAFLCIESGIDAAEWTRALKSFVMTQEIFMHLFRPAPVGPAPAVNAPLPASCPTPRPLDGRAGFDDANFDAAGRSDAARKAALRAKYAPMNLAALRRATRDNLRRAQCMP